MPILRGIRARAPKMATKRRVWVPWQVVNRCRIVQAAGNRQSEKEREAVRQNRISAVSSVIVSQSADADNVPTTCVILASLHAVAGESQLRLSMCGSMAFLPPPSPPSLSVCLLLIVLCDLVTGNQKDAYPSALWVINERTCWLSSVMSSSSNLLLISTSWSTYC